MQKSLVIQRRPGIGDLCLFLPFIHKIAKNLNFKKIDLITSSRSKSNQILYDDPYVDNIINYENFKGINGSFKLINFLRKNKYSNIFIMHYGIRYKILAKIAGIKKIYSYSNLKTSNSIVDDITNFTNLWTKDNSKHICKIYFNNHAALGEFTFLIFYVSAAMFATIPSLYKHGNNPNYLSLGASGAVSAIVFSYIVLNPLKELGIILLPGIWIPGFIFGILYILAENYMSKKKYTNIAHDAHISGSIFGILFIMFFDFNNAKYFFETVTNYTIKYFN